MSRICIDPGHGGQDPGATNGSLYEKDVVLDIGIKLKELFKAAGHYVVMTREDDTYLKPRQKANIGNMSKADIFVSLHCNAAENGQANGTEVLVYDDIGEAYRLGRFLQQQLVSTLRRKDRGIKIRPDLIVLNSTRMPAVLIEVAFISNSNEMQLMSSPGFRSMAADAIFKGVEDYLSTKINTDNKTKITFAEAKMKVKEKCGFDDQTMVYLEMYRYGEELIKRIAQKLPE